MKISKYTSFFHDGEILEINHNLQNIKIRMRSAELNPDLAPDIKLAKGNFFQGILHIEGVKYIIKNDLSFHGSIKLLSKDNDLLHLKIKENIVYCEISWRNTECCRNDFSAFEIHAERIWWENTPDILV